MPQCGLNRSDYYREKRSAHRFSLHGTSDSAIFSGFSETMLPALLAGFHDEIAVSEASLPTWPSFTELRLNLAPLGSSVVQRLFSSGASSQARTKPIVATLVYAAGASTDDRILTPGIVCNEPERRLLFADGGDGGPIMATSSLQFKGAEGLG